MSCAAANAQQVFVRRVGQVQHAQDQGDYPVAHGHLDLRQAVDDGQAGDQLAQRQDERAHARMEHRAGLHFRDEAAALLMEAHQHAAFLVHAAHRQARTVAIAPSWPVDGRGNDVGAHLADAGQAFLQDALFDRDLGTGFQMLQGTAPATVEVRASRRGAVGAGPEHSHGLGRVVLGMAAVDADLHLLARKRAVDERHLAVQARDAVPLLVEGFDANRRVHACQSARNCCQWAAPLCPRKPRTRLISATCASLPKAPRMCSKRRNKRKVLSTSVSQ